MDNIYRVLVFSVPFLVSLATFIWLGKKVLKVPSKAARIIAYIIIAAGLFHTGYQLMMSVDRVFRDDSFNFRVIFFNIFFFVGIAITMAFGSPEAEGPVKN